MSHTITIDANRGSSFKISSGSLSYTERFGDPGKVDLNTTLSEGNGSYQANQTYALANYSLAAGATLFIDMYDGTNSPKDVLNNAFSINKLKLAILTINNPELANNVLTIGPSGNANAAPLWFANTTMNMTVHADDLHVSPVSGWNVASGAGNFVIKNTGNQTCYFDLRLSGIAN